ncbi:MAG TPA: hypothetical protein VH374_01605 [Polyangia bacterium]|nr:hypothetical protein [Polyangia bacterium]
MTVSDLSSCRPNDQDPLEKSPAIPDGRGTATHDHMVTITPAEFATLKDPMAIMMTSTTTNGHDHVVIVMCA